MKVLALDLSTSTGVAFFENNRLIKFDNIKHKVKGNPKSPTYPFNYLDMAEKIAIKILSIIKSFKPDYIVIEETNKGIERYRQKQLEFIHFAIASHIRQHIREEGVNIKLRYFDTSAWRKTLSLNLSGNQRQQNKARKAERDLRRKEIYNTLYNQVSQKIQQEIVGLKKRETNKILKKWEKELQLQVGKEMGKFRSKIKNIDTKTLAVDYVNQHYKLNFKRAQNDIADAICIGTAFIQNNYQTQC